MFVSRFYYIFAEADDDELCFIFSIVAVPSAIRMITSASAATAIPNVAVMGLVHSTSFVGAGATALFGLGLKVERSLLKNMYAPMRGPWALCCGIQIRPMPLMVMSEVKSDGGGKLFGSKAGPVYEGTGAGCPTDHEIPTNSGVGLPVFSIADTSWELMGNKDAIILVATGNVLFTAVELYTIGTGVPEIVPGVYTATIYAGLPETDRKMSCEDAFPMAKMCDGSWCYF